MSGVQLRPQTWLFLLESRARRLRQAQRPIPVELMAEIHQLQRDIYPWAALTA